MIEKTPVQLEFELTGAGYSDPANWLSIDFEKNDFVFAKDDESWSPLRTLSVVVAICGLFWMGIVALIAIIG